MSLESNKVFAAVCIALISAWLTSFIADAAVFAPDLEKDAVPIEGAAATPAAAGGKPKLPDPIASLIAAADVAKGQKLSKACAACHSFDKGGPSKVGPNLWGIVGKAKAATSGFKYSDALKAKGGSWDYQSLNHFLWKPKKYAKGTTMSYMGIKKPADRAAMIAWLRTLGDTPAALPTEAEIAKEAAAFGVEDAPAAE